MYSTLRSLACISKATKQTKPMDWIMQWLIQRSTSERTQHPLKQPHYNQQTRRLTNPSRRSRDSWMQSEEREFSKLHRLTMSRLICSARQGRDNEGPFFFMSKNLGKQILVPCINAVTEYTPSKVRKQPIVSKLQNHKPNQPPSHYWGNPNCQCHCRGAW